MSIFVKNNKGWHLISNFSNSHCQELRFHFKLNDNNVFFTTIYVKPNTSIKGSDVGSVFQVKLRKNLDDSFVVSRTDFKISHVLNKFIEKRNKNNIYSNLLQFHSLVNEVINGFTPTKFFHHKKRDKWVKNEVKKLAALINSLYPEFLWERTKIKKKINTTKSETNCNI